MRGKFLLETAITIDTHEVAERTYITKFRSPRISPLVAPGQFIMVSFPETSDPLLPRAFSVCDATADTVSILYVAVGRATRKMSRLQPGDQLVFNGPLGKGFPEMSRGERIWVALGGSGAALVPILSRAAVKVSCEVHFFYGARTKEHLVRFGEAKSVRYSTDDGSEGFHGNVVELLRNELGSGAPDKLFGCGPTPMLAGMQREFGERIPTYLSVETPMACGIGFCQGCPVRRSGEGDYYLACKDGPVFRSTEIEFEVKS